MKKVLSWTFLFFLTITVINYPNPFNPKGGEITTFECTPDTSVSALLYIYDMSARKLMQKAYALTANVTSRTSWSGYNDNNELAGNGVYLYRVIDAISKSSLARGKIWIINR